MVEYFKSDARFLSPLPAFEPGCWINLVRPSSEEVTHVLAVTGVEEDFLRAALDPEESSRVEVEEEQTLLIVDIPTLEESNVEQDESKIFGTLPMGIIVLPNTVITVCLQDTNVLRVIAQNKVRDIHTGMRTRFDLQILLRVAGLFLRNLRMIERDFTKIERRLYDSLKNEELIQLLGLSKSLVYFSASLKGNEVTMEKMLRGRILKLYEDDRDLLEDALIEIRQAIEMAGIYSSIFGRHHGRLCLGRVQQPQYHHEGADGHHHYYDHPQHHLWLLRHEYRRQRPAAGLLVVGPGHHRGYWLRGRLGIYEAQRSAGRQK